MYKLFVVGCTILFSLLSAPALSSPPPQSSNYLQQQMILMGIYVYGINQELTKSVADLNELNFLAESILDIAEQAKKVEGDQGYHDNLDELLLVAKNLKEQSGKHNYSLAQIQAKSLINSCGKCHMKK